MPCSEKRARLLLERGRARVLRIYPFTIRLVDREGGDLQALKLKLDPGSKVTGVALVREAPEATVVLNLFDLVQRGRQISEALTARRSMRRGRRGLKTRYRAPRFDNRTRPQGWLAPSLQHRVDTTLGLVRRLRKLAPIAGLSQELVRFDTQAMQTPDIEGVEYQQGELAGYELREYLLEKWKRQCAYCDARETRLQVEHIEPRALGGSNRASNLTLACHPCNQRKAAQTIEAFLARDPERCKRIKAQAKAPLKDAAAVNATRWALFNALKATGLPIEVASGGRTKFNRSRLSIPKTHALDAACVGDVSRIEHWQRPTLLVKCTGRGAYQRTRLSAGGGIRGYLTRQKRHFGFQTGDMVRAMVSTGKKAGVHNGRVAVRASGSFNIQAPSGVVQGVSHKHCTCVQCADGYGYSIVPFAKGSESVGTRGEGAAAPSALYLPGMNAGVSRASQ
jgi:5-methylcytosine-specific restriction endonuclease McrA